MLRDHSRWGPHAMSGSGPGSAVCRTSAFPAVLLLRPCACCLFPPSIAQAPGCAPGSPCGAPGVRLGQRLGGRSPSTHHSSPSCARFQ